jgi:predicted Zn-dependent protease
MATWLSRDDARALCARILKRSAADEARVNVWSRTLGNTRFAVNQITTSGETTNLAISVTSAFGRRVASASTNRTDDRSLAAAVETSERLARLVPEDPEYLGELAPMPIPERQAVFDRTAGLTPHARAAAVATIARAAAARKLVSTGYVTHETGSTAVMTSKGQFAWTAASEGNITTTVRTPDGSGSGWAGTGFFDWAEVNAAQIAATAIDKAEGSRNPREVEPGPWVTILEPTAVASMIGLMTSAFGARQADEGRSYFSRPNGANRIGETFVDPRVTIWSDPMDRALLAPPFSAEGLPNRREVWVDKGQLRTLAYSRYWASRTKREPTGFISGFAMAGGEASIDEMIKSTARGLLVTRFWYIRGVDPRTILHTGLTRDGVFLIENGRIAHAVKNLRWNESPIAILNQIDMLGRPVRVSASESGDIAPAVVAPALKVKAFTFTSTSDAV